MSNDSIPAGHRRRVASFNNRGHVDYDALERGINAFSDRDRDYLSSLAENRIEDRHNDPNTAIENMNEGNQDWEKQTVTENELITYLDGGHEVPLTDQQATTIAQSDIKPDWFIDAEIAKETQADLEAK